MRPDTPAFGTSLMKKLVGAVLSSLLMGAIAAPAVAQAPVAQAAPNKVQPPRGFDTLGWLAGTRYIERDGVKSYETWTGVSGGIHNIAMRVADGKETKSGE